jgi:hypothetical protein
MPWSKISIDPEDEGQRFRDRSKDESSYHLGLTAIIAFVVVIGIIGFTAVYIASRRKGQSMLATA